MARETTILSIDVEADWGAPSTALAPAGAGIREGLPRLLELLDRHRARATFFVVGMLAEEVRARLDPDRGHEIGAHGHTHRRLTDLTFAEVEHEAAAARAALEAVGYDVIGFRAPFLAAPASLASVLARAGYRYDASAGSLWPSSKNRGGPRPARDVDDVARVPAGTLAGGLIPANLTWLRLLAPLGARLARRDGLQFSLHLHELVAPAAGAGGLATLPRPLRGLHVRNCGAPAIALLERVLTRGGRFVPCRDFLTDAGVIARSLAARKDSPSTVTS